MFLRNAWYPAMWSADLGEAPLARKLLGLDVVVYRGESGTVGALVDRCAHRAAPLSLGQRVGERLLSRASDQGG